LAAQIRTGYEAAAPPARNQPIKVACVGAGEIVRATHLPLLKGMPGVHVEWITDTNHARGRELAKVHEVPFLPLTNSINDLPPADVYLLACPFGVRDPYYAALKDRNVALYVEKPFARSAKRHREICADFPGYALASGLMMRSWGPNLLVRSILQQQVFGAVREVRFGFGKPGLVTQGNYYFDSKRGGAGMMSEVGIHGIDSVLFIADAVTADIHSVRMILEGDLDLHTEAQLRLHRADDTQCNLRFTISSLEETIEGIEVECENATLSYPLPGQGYALIGEKVDMGVTVRPTRGGGTYTIGPSYLPLYPATKFQMFFENWSTFLRGIKNREENFTSAASSLLTTQVIENCYQSQVAPASGDRND
jgi:predicted dehydrogenase